MVEKVRLRDVIEADLPTLFEHQLNPEANRMAAFTPRNEKEFFAHWKTKILADDTVVKRTVLVDGDVAGSVVSFARDGDREVGY